MIGRIWHGWTTKDNADAYETLLKTQIFPDILARKVPGFLRIDLLRRPSGEEVEFVTVMWFRSMQAVKGFAGERFETAVVPQNARALLERFDETSQHYEVREMREA